MNGLAKTPTTMTGPIVFAAASGALLLLVLAPSPARIALWDHQMANSPELRFPQSPQSLSQTELDTIIEHPLFNSDRKKDLPIAAQTTLPGLDTYRLAGVIAIGTSGIAIVERKQTKASVTLKVGDTLDGRTVTGITPGGITFSSAAGSETLTVPKIHGVSLAAPVSESSRIKSKIEGRGDANDMP